MLTGKLLETLQYAHRIGPEYHRHFVAEDPDMCRELVALGYLDERTSAQERPRFIITESGREYVVRGHPLLDALDKAQAAILYAASGTEAYKKYTDARDAISAALSEWTNQQKGPGN